MVFASTVFLFLFLPLSLLLYYNPLCRSRGYRNAVLLAVSLVFYAWGEPVFVGLMLLSILWNYVCGLRRARGKAGAQGVAHGGDRLRPRADVHLQVSGVPL